MKSLLLRPRAWPSRRDLRWASGLVLMVYVTTHLLNHTLGLVSLRAAESVVVYTQAVWHSLPGTVLLYGGASTHLVLAFMALWERHSLRMPWPHALRLAAGFSLPWLLTSHLLSMRGGYTWLGMPGSYARVIDGLWGNVGGWLQVLALILAWTHGCIGLHMALRRRAGWQRAQPVLLAFAVALPLMASLSFVSMGREATARPVPGDGFSAEQGENVGRLADGLQVLYLGGLGVLLLARLARGRLERLAGKPFISLQYPDRTVRVPRGWSVLEASRANGIEHLSMCGGRARCSTCRVRVQGPAVLCPPPGPDERRTLARVHAGPGVRLACQLRPLGDLQVTPLLEAATGPQTPLPRRLGSEREVAVLFVDLRRWSGLSERQWPVDLVYVLEHYFDLVGTAVREAGGVPNQFIGDSVMALFGLKTDLPTACHQAMHAAALINERLGVWGQEFVHTFGQPLEFGLGLHAGSAAIGEVGHLTVHSFTAVGEVVNTASRLQDHTKAASARMVLSVFAAQQAGLEVAPESVQQIAVRGRRAPIDVLALNGAGLERAWRALAPAST